MLDFNHVLENEKVKLRPLSKEDLAAFRKLTSEKAMWVYFTNDLSNADELTDFVETAINLAQKRERLAFTIIDNRKDEVAGCTSFGNISMRDKRIEIGWTWIGIPFQGTGINDQAKYLMLKTCFEDNDFERVEVKTDVLNTPARKALERMGFTREGILRSHTLMTHGRRRDTIYYSVLRDEWTKMKKRNNWL